MGVDNIDVGGFMSEGKSNVLFVFADMKMWINFLIGHESISVLVDFTSSLDKDVVNIVKGPIVLVQITIGNILDHQHVRILKLSRLAKRYQVFLNLVLGQFHLLLLLLLDCIHFQPVFN